jgi:hypothetical protein
MEIILKTKARILLKDIERRWDSIDKLIAKNIIKF